MFGPMTILLYKVQKEHETRDMFKSFAEISWNLIDTYIYLFYHSLITKKQGKQNLKHYKLKMHN